MLKDLLMRYPCLAECKTEIQDALQAIIACYERGGKVLTCGNGGSCADADHIVGELMKGFLKKRPVPDEVKKEMKAGCADLEWSVLDQLQQGLPALSLCSFNALNTAFGNDVNPDLIYAQAVFALGKPGDVLLCMSTSGNSKNVCISAQVAKSLGVCVVALTGKEGGDLSKIADICIRVPENETFRAQELHLPVYHYLCAATEFHFF